MSCIFCQIINGDIPADILYQDEDVLAFRDIAPQAPTHILIIPKRHIATLNDAHSADVPLLGKLTLTAARMANELGVAEEGYRTVINCNRHGGQTVYHIHMHLLAGRAMHWPPG